MNPDPRIRRFFRIPLRPDRVEREVEEELRFHLQEKTEKLIARGLEVAEARAEAERRFGDLGSVRRECRGIGRQRERRLQMRELAGSILQDIRFALRAFRRRPSFTVIALLSLALGIGANIAIFTLLYSVYLSPLPYPEAERLLYIEETAEAWGVPRMDFSYPDLVDTRARTTAFAGIAGFWGDVSFTYTGEGGAERITGSEVSWNFAEVMGVAPILGRAPRPEDEGPGVEKTVLIGEGLWRRKFGGDPDIVGRSITLAGEPTAIIGVMPAHFRFPQFSELWSPMRSDPTRNRGTNFITTVGRLCPGVTRAEALADLATIMDALDEEYWGGRDRLGVMITDLRDWVFGDTREPVLAFYAVVCLVLLLACANVANLLLAHMTTRIQEVAVRTALGAGRLRLVRQLLTESLLLALGGGGLGLGAGLLGRGLLLTLSPVDIPPAFTFVLRWEAVGLIALLVTLTGVLFGLAPALFSARTDLRRVLGSGSGHFTDGGGRAGVRSLLVAFEVALALTVLIGASLMVKSMIRQQATDPGYDPRSVASMYITLPDADFAEFSDMLTFYREAIDRVRALPGAEEASIVTHLPTGRAARESNYYVEGMDLPEGGSTPVHPWVSCEPEYFATLGIPLLAGRDFDRTLDRSDSPPVAIVNAAFARASWPDQDPIGKRLVGGSGPPANEAEWITVIGVTGDVFNAGFGQPVRPALYFPFTQVPDVDNYLVARTSRAPQALLAPMRAAVQELNGNVPLSGFRTVEEALAEDNWQVRVSSWIFGLFSVLALVLAAAGIYGVTAYAVTRRAREFCIRMALGALPGSVGRLVLKQGLVLCGAGMVLGLVLALAGARLLSGLLFRVHPLDPVVYLIAFAIMLAVAAAASLLPARRISRLTPMAVLREE